MYYETVITSSSCHNIFTIARSQFLIDQKRKRKKEMLCPQHFHNNFVTNFMWQGIFEG